MKIILSSYSERRRELLKKLKIPFVIYKHKVNEEIVNEKNPVRHVTLSAYLKAFDAFKRFKEGIAVGADTIVVLGDKIFGKPKNKKDAIKMLKELSGTRHKVYTAVAVINCLNGKTVVDYEVSEVKMRKIPDDEILLLAPKHIDKAGAYAIQDKGDKFVEYIKGDYYNVVGFPIKKFKKMLKSVSCRR